MAIIYMNDDNTEISYTGHGLHSRATKWHTNNLQADILLYLEG